MRSVGVVPRCSRTILPSVFAVSLRSRRGNARCKSSARSDHAVEASDVGGHSPQARTHRDVDAVVAGGADGDEAQLGRGVDDAGRDAGAAGRRGIPVSNVPEYGTDSVAQLTFALLLELCHHVGRHAEAVRAGEWARSSDFCFWKSPLVELVGKTMGVVGFGRIGQRVSELAHAFGMIVLAHSRSRPAPPAHQPFGWVGLDELFARSDVISLHCPLTADTAGLVKRERLQLVRPDTFLINTSRGGLVVEQDLAQALNESRLAGVAVDVVSAEPICPDNPLLTARNCLITPHIAWATREARRRLLEATVANVANFLAGRPTNVANRPGGGSVPESWSDLLSIRPRLCYRSHISHGRSTDRASARHL